MTPCGSVLSTAQIPCCLQTGICSLDRLKPPALEHIEHIRDPPKEVNKILLSFKHAHKAEGTVTPLQEHTA